MEGGSPSFRACGREWLCPPLSARRWLRAGCPGLGRCQRRAGASEANTRVMMHSNKAPEDRGFLGTMCSLTDCFLSKHVRK